MTKYLIPGSDSFIGSHIVEMLFEKGYKVKEVSQIDNLLYIRTISYNKYEKRFICSQGF